MTGTLSIDATKCTGCRLCETVCAVTKSGKVNPRYARIRVVRLEARDKPYFPVVHGHGFVTSHSHALHTRPDLELIFEEFSSLTPCDTCEGDPECARACEAGVLKYQELASGSAVD
ncbi:MAG TPA: hypothetical protein VMT71_03605 [Syntrophorhabdales bacterium]|nr:hypothetical protein [Syntrophorhabdales bacterium]